MDRTATKRRGRGGKRPGAGRRAGTTNALPYGAVKAIEATRLRLPPDASEQDEKLAGRALQRTVDVMEGRVKRGASQVLKAAAQLRQEVCGPIVQRHEHAGPGGAPITVEVVTEPGEGRP